MRFTIESAPKNGNVIILEDDVSGTYDVARWSPEAGEWIGEKGEPSKITPSHWYPLPGDNSLHQGLDDVSSSPHSGPPAPRTRHHSFSTPLSLRRAEPQGPTVSEVIAAVEAQTAKRTRHARQGLASSSIGAVLLGAALIGIYFRADVSAYVARYAGQQDFSSLSTFAGQVITQAMHRPSQHSRQTDLSVLQLRAEPDQANAETAMQDTAQVKQAVQAPVRDWRPSLQEKPRADVLANELVEAKRTIDASDQQLRAGAARSASSLEQERAKTTALAQEHDRAEALARELATARRDLERQAALLRKVEDEAMQFKQGAESTIAQLRQFLQQEHDRAEALARDLVSAQRPPDERVALGPEANSQAAETTQAADATATEQPTTEAQGNPEATRLIARAYALLGQGNIGAARIVLERAAEKGSAQASFMLAETYDPTILPVWGTYGTRGEATKAREFYAKAHAGGIQQAKDRVDALRQ